MTFLEYYKANLAHIRSLGAEFAAEFPKIAARLELSSFECADPYVERLLEGTAFLAARVEQKMESGFPRLLESILSGIAPLALQNIPSYCILELQQKKKCCILPRWTRFQTNVPGVKTPCTFSTIHDFTNYGIEVESAGYYARDLSQFQFSSLGGVSAIEMMLSAPLEMQVTDDVNDKLDIYLDMPDGEASRLMELFYANRIGIYTLGDDDSVIDLSDELSIDLPVFRDYDFTAGTRQSLPGLSKLLCFSAYPAVFKFLQIKGISRYFSRPAAQRKPLYFVFSKYGSNLARSLSAENFRTACFPAVNVFRKTSDRCQVNGQYEHHIVPDRTAPLDYEVYDISSVDVFNDSNQTLFTCSRDYNFDINKKQSEDGDFFVLHREERLVPEQRNARSSYIGSEAYLSFYGQAWKDRKQEISQIQAEILCTNRELPLLVHNNAVFTSNSADKLTATLIGMPSRPEMPLIHQGSKSDWEKVSFISFNMSGMMWDNGNAQIKTLQNLIHSYNCRATDETDMLSDGILSLESTPQKFRFMQKGCVFYESGWDIAITLKEQSYEGVGLLMFAMILRDVISGYLPFNSCMQLTIKSDSRGEVTSWQM